MVNLNKKRGISLIVLVITIIVMIILAAAIILSLNSSGIIGKANQAKTDSDKASIEEYVSTLRAEWELQDIATREASFSEYANAKLVEKGYTGYTVTEDGKVQKFINGGAVDVANNASTYYGKAISNYTAGGVNEWQVFHSDGENIYLIAKDYVDIPESMKASNTEKNGLDVSDKLVCFYSMCETGTPTAWNDYNTPIGNKWLNLAKNIDNGYNMVVTKYMLDTSKWSSFKDSIYATYAIGGPTIEMFCDSYNKINDTKIYCDNANNNGYYVGNSTNSTSTAISGLNNPSTNELYYITRTNSAYSYWLASPSAYDNAGFIMDVYYDGRVVCSNYNDGSDMGIRPVVCLNSNVKLVQDGANYKLEK